MTAKLSMLMAVLAAAPAFSNPINHDSNFVKRDFIDVIPVPDVPSALVTVTVTVTANPYPLNATDASPSCGTTVLQPDPVPQVPTSSLAPSPSPSPTTPTPAPAPPASITLLPAPEPPAPTITSSAPSPPPSTSEHAPAPTTTTKRTALAPPFGSTSILPPATSKPPSTTSKPPAITSSPTFSPIKTSEVAFTDIRTVEYTPGKSTPEIYQNNLNLAVKYMQEFKQLTLKSSCADDTLACVTGMYAVCAGGRYQVQPCGTNSVCGIIPSETVHVLDLNCWNTRFLANVLAGMTRADASAHSKRALYAATTLATVVRGVVPETDPEIETAKVKSFLRSNDAGLEARNLIAVDEADMTTVMRRCTPNGFLRLHTADSCPNKRTEDEELAIRAEEEIALLARASEQTSLVARDETSLSHKRCTPNGLLRLHTADSCPNKRSNAIELGIRAAEKVALVARDTAEPYKRCTPHGLLRLHTADSCPNKRSEEAELALRAKEESYLAARDDLEVPQTVSVTSFAAASPVPAAQPHKRCTPNGLRLHTADSCPNKRAKEEELAIRAEEMAEKQVGVRDHSYSAQHETSCWTGSKHY